jgi:excisionase family DNA binding protein
MNEPRLTLTVGEAAKLLRLSRAFTYELVARGELPSLRFGRRVVIPRIAIERILNHSVDALPPPA